jgi:hypothetical protein
MLVGSLFSQESSVLWSRVFFLYLFCQMKHSLVSGLLREYFQKLNPFISRLGPIFLDKWFPIQHIQALQESSVLTYSSRWFQSWFLRGFDFFEFWCSQSVPMEFAKDSPDVLISFFKLPNGLSKFPKCSSTYSQEQQHMEHLPNNGLHPHMPYLSHYVTEGTT